MQCSYFLMAMRYHITPGQAYLQDWIKSSVVCILFAVIGHTCLASMHLNRMPGLVALCLISA